MVAIATDPTIYHGGLFPSRGRDGYVTPRRSRWDRPFGKDPFPFAMPQRPSIPATFQKTIQARASTTSNITYSQASETLLKEGATSKQIDIWRDTFTSLEAKELPTDEFTLGFIELVKVNATDIELDSFASTAEMLLTASNSEASLDDLTSRYLDVIQRKDLTERSRRRLLLNEQVKVIKDSAKSGSISTKEMIKLAANLGLKFICYLLGTLL